MNFHEAQENLAASILSAARKVNSYFWRLSGEEPNSLCKFLGMEEKELKVILRLCTINSGDKHNFKKNKFELIMALLMKEECGFDYTYFKVNGKTEWFIQIGVSGCDDSLGSLLLYPIEGEHFQNLRTKSQRGSLQKLLDVSNNNNKNGASTADDVAQNEKKIKQSTKIVSPKDVLFEFVQELVTEAGGELSERASRSLHQLIRKCVDAAAKELLHTALEKYSCEVDNVAKDQQGKRAVILSPERILSESDLVVVTPAPLAARCPGGTCRT